MLQARETLREEVEKGFEQLDAGMRDQPNRSTQERKHESAKLKMGKSSAASGLRTGGRRRPRRHQTDERWD